MTGRQDEQYRLLREATGRLVGGGASGTGFFVAPNLLLTAAHVVAPSLAKAAELEFHWHGRVVGAVVKKIFPSSPPPLADTTYPYPDLAVVSVRLDGEPLPLLADEPTPGDELYAYGYTDEYPQGDSALFVYEGPTNPDELLYRLKDAQARPGLSGAPLLDVTRRGIVAVVKRSRDKASDLGSRAVPMATVLAYVPTLAMATSRRPPLSDEAVNVERLLDMQKRNLEAYEEDLARRRAPRAEQALARQAELARDAVAALESRLDALTPPAPKSWNASAREAPATLPPRGEFVGRITELSQLRKALESRSPVVAIEGMGGVGKTALALEVAHDWLTAGFEGVVWASNVPRPVALPELIDTAARALDYPAVTRMPEDQKSGELRRVLAGRRYLIVLDGFEAVDDESVEAFVRSLPEANKTLLTSRRSVSDVRTIGLRGLTIEEAMDLLHREAERIGVEGIEEITDQLADLHDLIGGSPLGLKWALGLMRHGYELPDVVQALHDAEGEVFNVIMGRTWDRLSDPARRLLTVMPCFAGPASKPQMQATADMPGPEFDTAVEELTRGWLLEPQGTLSRRVFRVPGLLRAFASYRLRHDDPELENAARSRFVAAFISLVSECRSGYSEGFDRIESDLVNVFAAMEWCHTRQQWQHVIELADGLAEFLWVRGYWSERIKRSTQGLEAARALGDGIAAGRFAYFIGWVHSRWNNEVETLRWADEAEAAMAETYGAENPYALQLRGLAAFRRTHGVAPATAEEEAYFQTAEAFLHRALELFDTDERLPNATYLVTTVKDNLGELYRDWGRNDAARSWFKEVLADAEANRWEERLATSNGDLGDLASKAGDDQLASQLYETGLAYAIRIKRANTIAMCRLGLGRSLRRQGKGTQAYDHLREALEIYRRLNAEKTVEAVEAELRSLAAELAPPAGLASE